MNTTKTHKDIAKINIRDIAKSAALVLILVCLFMEFISFFISPVLVTILCWCIYSIGIIINFLYIKEMDYKYFFDWELNEQGFPELADECSHKVFAFIFIYIMVGLLLATAGYYVGLPILSFSLIMLQLFSSTRLNIFIWIAILLDRVLSTLCKSPLLVMGLLNKLQYFNYVNAWQSKSIWTFQNPFNQTLSDFYNAIIAWYNQCYGQFHSLFTIICWLLAMGLLCIGAFFVFIFQAGDMGWYGHPWFEKNNFKQQLRNKNSFEEADAFINQYTDWDNFQWKVVCLQKLFWRKIEEPSTDEAEEVYKKLINSICHL